MQTKILSCLIPLLFLSGCVDMQSYVEPKTGSQPLATVSGSFKRNSWFVWNSNIVTMIDGKSARGMFSSENTKNNVSPGLHSFAIATTFNTGLTNNGRQISIVELPVNVKPGMDYRFVSQVKGDKVNVWAIDRYGRMASGVGSGTYKLLPFSSTVSVERAVIKNGKVTQFSSAVFGS